MKNLVLVFVLATALLGQTGDSKHVQVTGVAGESWLNHLHRTLEETSMGKTGRLGPSSPMSREQVSDWVQQPSADSLRHTVTVHGSDLYRLNCRGCHGELGLGAPPEINSVINPTRATSVALTIEKMHKLGMEMSRADAAQLANQSKTTLLERLHNGGTDMPPFHHLSDREIQAIFAYLKQLAEVPGAEKQQATVEESPVRIGEHVVKSTCHICHNAAGPNPSPEQLLSGAIPPLNTLITRTSLPEFAKKVRHGAPIMMGRQLAPYRGRMPVFYYLKDDEVADAYLYLRLYPPYEWAVLDPAKPAPEQNQAASNVVLSALDGQPPNPLPRGKSSDARMVTLPLVAEIFVALLLAGGLGFTVREVRKLSARHARRSVLVVGGGIALQANHPEPSEAEPQQNEQPEEFAFSDNVAADASNHDHEGVRSHVRIHHNDHRAFESSWLARRFEDEDWVA